MSLFLSHGWNCVVTSRDLERCSSATQSLKQITSGNISEFVGDPSTDLFWKSLYDSNLPFFDCIVVCTVDVQFNSTFRTTSQEILSATSTHVCTALFALQFSRWQIRKEKNQQDNAESNLSSSDSSSSLFPPQCTVFLLGSTLSEESEMDCCAYTVVKHALLGLFRSACTDLFGMESRLRIALILPNNVDTPLWASAGCEEAPSSEVSVYPQCNCVARFYHSQTGDNERNQIQQIEQPKLSQDNAENNVNSSSHQQIPPTILRCRLSGTPDNWIFEDSLHNSQVNSVPLYAFFENGSIFADGVPNQTHSAQSDSNTHLPEQSQSKGNQDHSTQTTGFSETLIDETEQFRPLRPDEVAQVIVRLAESAFPAT